MALTEKQIAFLDFATRFEFVGNAKTELIIPKKVFFGLFKSKEVIVNDEQIKYNDFSFHSTKGGNFEWRSGNSGDFRPEGYTKGSEDADKSIKNRLELLVVEFNLNSKFVAQIVNNLVILE